MGNQPMNVVLVVFDSLRKDCVGAYGSPPWGKVHTPQMDQFASESLLFSRFFPEALPTLPARRALYTGRRNYPFHRSDFRHKGDFTGAPGWGPIPEEWQTLAELLGGQAGYRTGLISDVYHMFKPSKNFWRGFDQWTFVRGQETDPYRSGPRPCKKEIDKWLAPELQDSYKGIDFICKCLQNMYGRDHEEDYWNARVMTESSRWLEENRDADNFFLVVECFDPHEPWFVPEPYRSMYGTPEGPDQVVSPYRDVADRVSNHLVERARANYSGLVTMVDRWFGHLVESMRVQGVLDNTMVIVMSDHGHSMGDEGYIGKRGYPSRPEVFETVLMVRHPDGLGAGQRSDMLLQHTDISATILDLAGIEPSPEVQGRPFWQAALNDEPFRDHITAAWGSAVTVIDDQWWMNCKVDGSGVFLHDLDARQPFEQNLAADFQDEVRSLYAQAVEDAGGSFPDYLVELAQGQADAPGCSPLAARV